VPAWQDAEVTSIEVADVVIEREKGVTIRFEDGKECTFGLEELRMACPCAGCRSSRDRDVAPWPTPRSPLPLTISTAKFVGAWGLAITWNDGHATGIYPWTSMREWCDSGQATYPPDSGLGGGSMRSPYPEIS